MSDRPSPIRWLYLLLAVAMCSAVLWMLNDLRVQTKRTTEIVNTQLPAILDRTKRSADTLVVLSEDIRQLRDLAGASDTARDKSLAAYADRLLDAVEAADAKIGLKPKLIGDALKETVPAKEWVADARKEALLLTFRVASRAEFVERLCKNKYGSDWYIEPAGGRAVMLKEWVAEHVPEEQGDGGVR